MPFINMNINDAQEAKPVPAGRYDLTIAACEVKLTKEHQRPQFRAQISIDGHDDAPNIFEYVAIPSPDDDAKAQSFKALLLKRFCSLFKVTVSDAGFDPEDLALQMVGATANCELKQEEYEGNVSNKLVIPRLSEEKGAAGRGAPPKRRTA